MSARYALRRPVMRATLVSASPVVPRARLPPFAQSQTMPPALPSTIVQTSASPAVAVACVAERSARAARRDRHLGHGVHLSNGS